MFKKLLSSVEQKIQSFRGIDVELLRRTLMVYVVIFVVWGLYRLLLRFPASLEELIFKPVVFLLPALSMLMREGRREREVFRAFGFRRSNILLSVYFGLTLGLVYLIAVALASFVFAPSITFSALSLPRLSLLSVVVISLATAVWEQITFSGFILLRLKRSLKDEWRSIGLTAFLFTMLHIPILCLEASSQFLFVVIQMMLLFLVGFGNAIVMLRTKNVLAPILSHTFWALTLGLLG